MSVPDHPFETHTGRSTLGGARQPQPLGRDDSVDVDARSGLTGPPRGTRVADAMANKRTRDKKKARKSDDKGDLREITIVGSFKNPFASRADEIKAMKENRWEPSTDDFVDVAGTALTVDHFHTIFGAILVEGNKETKAGSIKRINIFTHANPSMIAFSGQISSVGAMASVTLRTNGAMTPGDLQALTQGQTFNVASKNKTIAAKTFTLDDIRRRFAKDAVIVLYACKSGIDSGFLQEIADTFQVKVRGFNDLVGYFPTFDEGSKSINRRHVGIGRNALKVETDFHELDKNSKAIERSPAQ